MCVRQFVMRMDGWVGGWMDGWMDDDDDDDGLPISDIRIVTGI